MVYQDLKEISSSTLKQRGELRRISLPVDTYLEMTEIADRVLRAGGPALLFEKPHTRGRAQAMPVLVNLFGTPQRVAYGMGEDAADWRTSLREVGSLLAFLKEPEPPKGLRDAWEKWPVLKQVLNMSPKRRSRVRLARTWCGRAPRSIWRVYRFSIAGRAMSRL